MHDPAFLRAQPVCNLTQPVPARLGPAFPCRHCRRCRRCLSTPPRYETRRPNDDAPAWGTLCPGPRPKISLGCFPRAARRIFATIVWSSLPGLSSWLPWLSRRPAAFAPFPQMMHRNCGTRVCAQQHDCHMAPPPPVSPATLARPSTSTIWGAEDTPPSPRLAHHHWGRGHDMPPSPPPLAVSIRCHRRQSNWQPPAAASNAARVTCCRSVRVRPGPSPVVFLPVHYGSCRLASRCPRPWRSPTCSSGRRHNA
jgi:hypothetical protein